MLSAADWELVQHSYNNGTDHRSEHTTHVPTVSQLQSVCARERSRQHNCSAGTLLFWERTVGQVNARINSLIVWRVSYNVTLNALSLSLGQQEGYPAIQPIEKCCYCTLVMVIWLELGARVPVVAAATSIVSCCCQAQNDLTVWYCWPMLPWKLANVNQC